jgi:hypothetical protein
MLYKFYVNNTSQAEIEITDRNNGKKLIYESKN